MPSIPLKAVGQSFIAAQIRKLADAVEQGEILIVDVCPQSLFRPDDRTYTLTYREQKGGALSPEDTEFKGMTNDDLAELLDAAHIFLSPGPQRVYVQQALVEATTRLRKAGALSTECPSSVKRPSTCSHGRIYCFDCNFNIS
jgi:hypothetical protein